jgi:acyl-CoA thioester hydrolase
VYWEDTDAGGIVFYANYLRFFERARTEWLRALGLGQQALAEQTGAIFVVSRTAVDYRRPARLDDLLHLTVQLRRCGRAGFEVHQQAWRGTELLCEGQVHVACVDRLTFRPRRMPDAVLQPLSSFACV